MPSNTIKTIKRVATRASTKRATAAAKIVKATTSEVKTAPRSVAHRESAIEWLREDVMHGAALLEAALETGDAGDFMAALRLITEARGGIAKIAEITGLNREALYRTLSKRGNPQLSSLLPILQATGLKIAVQAV